MRNEFAFTIGRESQASSDVIGFEVGEIADDLLGRHAASEIVKHVVNGDPQIANTRLPATLARLNGDTISVSHCCTIEF